MPYSFYHAIVDKMADEYSWILPKEMLGDASPSRKDLVSTKEEKVLRFKTTWFMEEFGQSIGR